VLVDLPSLNLTAGSNRVSLSGSFSHPVRDFSEGSVRLHVASNSLQVAQIKYLQQRRPGLSGALSLNIDAAGAISPVEPKILLSSLKGNTSATGLRLNGRDYGEFHASAEQTGSMLNVNLDSNLAQSSINGKLQTQLAGDYQTAGQLTFKNVSYSNWSALFGSASSGAQSFDAVTDGSMNASVSILKPANLSGSAQLSKLEILSKPKPALGGPHMGAHTTTPLALRNDGPIEFTASQSAIHVQKANLVGNSTHIALKGNVALAPVVDFDLTVDGDANLALLHELDSNISSDGQLTLNAGIKGAMSSPTINGKLQLKDAAFQTADMSNGISKANGVIQFNGDVARIESLTAESGGGKITVSGFVGRNGSTFTYGLTARAIRMRVRQASGVSVVANANVKLTGTSANSLLSGDVIIGSVKFNPQTDFGSILASSTPPPETDSLSSPLAAIKLNLDVRTAPGASFQTSLAENLRAQANLTVRGTVANPGVLGRIVLTEGVLVFFGTKYTINDATVSFYNPNKIEPILNLSMVTKARGVEVTLNVSGPVNNMNLSYQSDPPLPFSEIVGLLAAGKTPTSDAVLLAQQPATPPQNFQQMGESALLSQAVSNPISGQLQRVFGVSQLKIDPTFTSGSELPQARLTLQQQIASGLTFTYITNLTRTDSQIVRVEWALNPQWSLIATREENGLFGVDFFYKRRFR
jgi:translocation and assembly module TamB